MDVRFLGRVPYNQGREVQNALVEQRRRGEIPDLIVLCEHPEIITVGRGGRNAAQLGDLRHIHGSFFPPNIDVIQVDRGGLATYHGPGQLVIYPVVSLRERKMGVREFVSRGLNSIASGLCEYGISPTVQLDPAGVWVRGSQIASVGLRITDGVTNHGFSLNIRNDLSVYQHFVSCGLRGVPVTSLCEEITDSTVDVELASRTFGEYLRKAW